MKDPFWLLEVPSRSLETEFSMASPAEFVPIHVEVVLLALMTATRE
jgi:hypothetical protein